MNKKMEKALNDQLNHELSSSYQYFAMAAHFDEVGLPGFANWMKTQAQEELGHVMKFYTYITDRNGTVVLGNVSAPKSNWKTPKDVFEFGLKAEQNVTKQINSLVTMAQKEMDHATNNFLQWFVSEQVEEEALFTGIIQKLTLIGTDKPALVMMDQELGNRPPE